MNRDDVIRMAREAGLLVIGTADGSEAVYTWPHGITDELERFAALVAAHVRETEFKPDWMNYQQGLVDGAAAEREACARVCEDEDVAPTDDAVGVQQCIAAAIRARGQA